MQATSTTPPLARRVRLLAAFGLPVALLRYACEFFAPDVSMYFGVYFLMPVLFLVLGVQGAWGAIRWPALLSTMALTCLIVWGIPNTLAYTTGQFLEWNHGRFFFNGWEDEASRAAPIADTALGKVSLGLLQGLITSAVGTFWCTSFGTALIWLPGRLRNRGR